MPSRDEIAIALKNATIAGASEDARQLQAMLADMDRQAPTPASNRTVAPAATSFKPTPAPQPFQRLDDTLPPFQAPPTSPQRSTRQTPPLVPENPLPDTGLGAIIRGESKNDGQKHLERASTRLGVKEGGRPNAYSESPDIVGGLGDLVAAANYGVRDWWRHTDDKSKGETAARIVMEGTGAPAIARFADHVGQKTGNEFLQDQTGQFTTDEAYNPENELAAYVLNAGSWGTRNQVGDMINPRKGAPAPKIGPELPVTRQPFKFAEIAPAAADVATNLTMGASDVTAAGFRGAKNAISAFAKKPGAELPPINQTAVVVPQPQPAGGNPPPPFQPPVAPTANAVPPPGNLQPVPTPPVGAVSGEFQNLHPKVQAAFNRLMEASGVEPQRIPGILRSLDQLPADRAEMVATALIKRFGAGDPKLQTNLTAVGRDFTVNTPTGKGDNAQAVVRDNIRQAVGQEASYVEGVAERNFGPGVVATQEVIDQNLRQMRGQYQKLLDPKRPYGNKRSATNKTNIDTARSNLAGYLKQVDVAQEIPDWLKRDTLNTLNRDLREMGLEPLERSSINSGFTWAEMVDQYPTQIAHALQSTYATASREADMAKLGDLKAGAFKRDMQELRGQSQKRANAANPADRGYGLLHLLEEAVPGYKQLRVDFGTEHGAKTALTMPQRFLTAVGDEVRFADLLEDLDDLRPEQLKTAENQITTLVRDAIRKKQENPTLAEIGAGERGLMTPNLERLAQGPVLDGLERAFGDKGKELADAIRLSRATTQTLSKIEPDFGPRTASNITDAAEAPKLYEDPKATGGSVIDQTSTVLGGIGLSAGLMGNLPAAAGIMSLAAAKAAWNAIKNGKKLSPDQRTQFAKFLFALRRAEAEPPQGALPPPVPQLPAPPAGPGGAPPRRQPIVTPEEVAALFRNADDLSKAPPEQAGFGRATLNVHPEQSAPEIGTYAQRPTIVVGGVTMEPRDILLAYNEGGQRALDRALALGMDPANADVINSLNVAESKLRAALRAPVEAGAGDELAEVWRISPSELDTFVRKLPPSHAGRAEQKLGAAMDAIESAAKNGNPLTIEDAARRVGMLPRTLAQYMSRANNDRLANEVISDGLRARVQAARSSGMISGRSTRPNQAGTSPITSQIAPPLAAATIASVGPEGESAEDKLKRMGAVAGLTVGVRNAALLNKLRPDGIRANGVQLDLPEVLEEGFEQVTNLNHLRQLQREFKNDFGRPSSVRLSYDPASGKLYAYNGHYLTHSEASQILGLPSGDLRAELKPGDRFDKITWHNAGNEDVAAPRPFDPPDEGTLVYRGSAEDQPGVIENGRLGLGKYAAEDAEIGAEWGGQSGKVDAYRVKGKLFDLDEKTAAGLENYEKQANTPAADALFARLRSEGYVGIRDPWSGHINVFDDAAMVRHPAADKELGRTWTNDPEQAGFGGARKSVDTSDDDILGAVQRLSPREFEVWKLGRQGMTPEDIAVALGGPEATVTPEAVARAQTSARKKGFDIPRERAPVNPNGRPIGEETARVMQMLGEEKSNAEIFDAVYPGRDRAKAMNQIRQLRFRYGRIASKLEEAKKPEIEQSTFAGVNAKTADLKLKGIAEQMEKAGAGRDQIWKETGWFKGNDGKWRFEIDDSKAGFNAATRREFADRGVAKIGKSGGVAMDNAINHAELQKSYPQVMAQTYVRGDVRPDTSTRGSFNPGTSLDPAQIGFKAPDLQEGRSVVLHEGQHGVQNVEGFARGGSVTGEATDYILDEVDKIRSRMQAVEAKAADVTQGSDEFNRLWDEYQALENELERVSNLDRGDVYKRLAGEVEARNVQTRRDFTPEERRARPPWTTQDVPDDQQIVRFGNGEARSEPAQNGVSLSSFIDPVVDTYGKLKQGLLQNDPRQMNDLAAIIQSLDLPARAGLESNAKASVPLAPIEAAGTPTELAELIGRSGRIDGRKGTLEPQVRDYQTRLADQIMSGQRAEPDLINRDKAAGPIGAIEKQIKSSYDWSPAREAEQEAALAALIMEGQRPGGGIPQDAGALDRFREGVAKGEGMSPLDLNPRDMDRLADLLFNPAQAKTAASLANTPVQPWVSDAERRAIQIGVPATGLAAAVMGGSSVSNQQGGQAEPPQPVPGSSPDQPIYTVPDRLMPPNNPSEPPPELNYHIKDTFMRAQQRLGALGYMMNGQDADGVDGPQTRRAVAAFQSTNGLPQTGELDPATLRALWGGKNYGSLPTMREYGQDLAPAPQ